MRRIFNIKLLSTVIFFLGITPYFCYAESDTLIKIKQAIQEKGLQWSAAENWITRLPAAEKEKLYIDTVDYPLPEISELVTLPPVYDLPVELDWRDIDQENYITPVKNQGICNSCWAFSAVAQIESWWLIENQRPDTILDLSEQYLLSQGEAGSCQGGYVSKALSVVKKTGIPPEWCFEYQATDSIPLDSAYVEWQDYKYTIPGWGYITKKNPVVLNIKQALMYHPVSASMTVHSDFEYYQSGIYEPAVDTTEGRHAILIVGWNDNNRSWLCKNSWGDSWGDNGFFQIKWGVCDIGDYIPFIWNEIERGDNFIVLEDSLQFILTQGDSTERMVSLFNTGPEELDYSALAHTYKFHVDSFNAYEGTSWWCGIPGRGYFNHWLQYLETPVIDLSQTRQPFLEWKGFWALEDPWGTDPPWDGWDGCNVWISIDGGETYSVIEPEFPEYNCRDLWSFGHSHDGWDMGLGIPGWAGNSGGWTDVRLDLKEYRSSRVILRWAFASDLGYCTFDNRFKIGFFVDNITVKNEGKVIFSNKGEFDNRMAINGFDTGAPSWLTITNGVGSIFGEEQIPLNLNINTDHLSPGTYNGQINITVSDRFLNSISIPVHLQVLKKEKVIVRLFNNSPNPFNGNTSISYYLPEKDFVTMKVFNIAGKEICTLINKVQSAGIKKVNWDGKDSAGHKVSSGVYFYCLISNNRILSKKMLHIK